jgi:hypothetical protein
VFSHDPPFPPDPFTVVQNAGLPFIVHDTVSSPSGSMSVVGLFSA